jgi:hypothetical protein
MEWGNLAIMLAVMMIIMIIDAYDFEPLYEYLPMLDVCYLVQKKLRGAESIQMYA